MSSTVGVRELRQNLSKYLERVKQGETLTVTERGKEVARLVRTGPEVSPYYQHLAEKYGATIPKGDLVETIERISPRLKSFPAGYSDAMLEEMRRERA